MSSDSGSSSHSHRRRTKKIRGSVKITGDLKVKGTTTACELKTQHITPCNTDVPITLDGDLQINGSINASGPVTFPDSAKICTLVTQNVSPCTGDTVFFHSEVASGVTSVTLGPIGVFKADDSTSANMSLVIEPKGTGALQASESGNVRGQNAVDLQTIIFVPTRVASGDFSVVSGGRANEASGTYSVVCGGTNNQAFSQASVVSGGSTNQAINVGAVVGGGQSNTASGITSVVCGGTGNVASGTYSIAACGNQNTASGSNSAVSGGNGNVASNDNSVVSGGTTNTASGLLSVVSGGDTNAASGNYSIVSGGRNNATSGAYSFVAGVNANSTYDNTFVWSGGSLSDTTTSSAANQVVFNLVNSNYTPAANPSTFYIQGNFHVDGNSTVTGGKSFEIPHPVVENKRLRFYCLEGPSVDLVYRGEAQLANGQAVINIDKSVGLSPGTFAALNQNIQVFVTNNENWDLVKVKDKTTLASGVFTIISNNPDSNILVDWLVIGKRVGVDSQIEIDVPAPQS